MQALVLAAGYGTRLQRDIEAAVGNGNESLRHLLNLPKPLLPIGTFHNLGLD
jgi:NDP-sugar pyrophosphorylase family protein